MACFMLTYATYRFSFVISQNKYKTNLEIYEYHFGPNDKIGAKEGFAIAATISSFDGNPNSIEDEEIGTIKFFTKSWGEEFDDDINFKELKQKKCTDADYSEAFYPLHERMSSFAFFKKKMKCIDEAYEVWGTYSADETSNLMVVFDRCDSTKRTCKSEMEIDKWLEFKYIILLQNERQYLQTIDNPQGRVKEHSIMSQHAVSSTERTDWPRMVTITEVIYNAHPWSVDIEL